MSVHSADSNLDKSNNILIFEKFSNYALDRKDNQSNEENKNDKGLHHLSDSFSFGSHKLKLNDQSESESLVQLKWRNQPSNWFFNDKGLIIHPNKKTDFWKKTYYTPLLDVHSGHILAFTLPSSSHVTVTTKFKISPLHQFDQAGIAIYIDNDHWIKSGIEVVDKIPRVSSVVTNHYSDWSTAAYQGNTIIIRAHKLGSNVVIEYASVNENDSNPNDLNSISPSSPQNPHKFEMIRIAHLDNSHHSTYEIGIFTCAPTDSGSSVLFEYLTIEKPGSFQHSAS